jgi:hypothetical protein
VARTAGWHRLVVRFTPSSLVVACDDEVLWYTLERGPGGPLRSLSLKCAPLAPDAKTRGAVAWAAVSLERAVDGLPRPPAEEGQDEVWLASGDQVFGKALRADRRAVTLEGRFGTRSFAWADLRGLYLAREPVKARPVEGARVTLGLRSGLNAEEDVLTATLSALDDKVLTLRHLLLGELRIDRRFVATVRPR